MTSDRMTQLVSLCKRRGFVFQSSEIYGGLKSCYDYGPLGVQLKRNIANLWWQSMVEDRDNVVGLDASIMMHPRVWETSGHVSGFSDPLVDCYNCKERFRADKVDRRSPGEVVRYQSASKKGQWLEGEVAPCGYVCPFCGCPKLSPERQFNGMFRTTIGPIDGIDDCVRALGGGQRSEAEVREILTDTLRRNIVYLRPETAQAMFVQFLNVLNSTSVAVPFGIAQMGKSFRNEIVVEHFIFRSCEFEQMEMEFFVEPGTEAYWLQYWREERLQWYQQLANAPERFRLRRHDEGELAHYSDDCYDIEFQYPWGWDELEGVASRTDYDLKKHAAATGQKLSYFDQKKPNPDSGKMGWRYTPYVIEPAAGLTRSVLAFLADAYAEETGQDSQGGSKTRTVLKLHPKLAPVKVAILPLVKKEGQPETARNILRQFKEQHLLCSLDEQQSIGKRYAKHDEIGTPFCVTVDQETMVNRSVTLRNRDDASQRRVTVDEAIALVQKSLR